MNPILVLLESTNFMAIPFTIVSVTNLGLVVQFNAPLTNEQLIWILPVLIRYDFSVTTAPENVYFFTLPSTGVPL